MDVLCPYDRSLIERLPVQVWEEVEPLLRREWSIPSKELRLEMLGKILTGLRGAREELVNLAILEGGKPRRDTVVEFERALQGVQSAIATLRTEVGEMIPMDLNAASRGRIGFTEPSPVGRVLAISAFNHPINNIIHQVIPAVAVGCPILIKPAERTPLSCRKIVQICQAAGADCEMLTVALPTLKRVIAESDYVSFIGSAQVGWQLRRELPAGVGCMLEHGGSAPVILLEDVDLDRVIPSLIKGAFYHAGQVCVSIQRIYCAQERIAELTEKMKGAVDQLVVGDPNLEETDVGPMIEPDRVERLEGLVSEGEVICGGKRLSDTLFAPTVMRQASQTLLEEEIFGPVVCLEPYGEVDEAVRAANHPPFTFQAAVFGERMESLLRVARGLKGTAVMVNQPPTFRVDWMPFGGQQLSGMGLGGIPYAMRELAPPKLIVI